MNKKIGFIGTGLMGFPMAKNLLKTNYSLKVFSRSINKAKPLETFGAKICNNLIEVVSDSDLVIFHPLMLGSLFLINNNFEKYF